jgi:hypothetical protein
MQTRKAMPYQFDINDVKDISYKSPTNEEDEKMKSLFKSVVCAGIVGVGSLLFGGGSARGETLQDAIKYVLQTNPEIKAISYNRLARDQEVIQAKGGYYPTLDASLSAGLDRRMNAAASTKSRRFEPPPECVPVRRDPV